MTMEKNEATHRHPGGPIETFENAPLPTAATLRKRHSLIRQFIKFVGFDLTILRMVAKGHDPKH